MGWTVKEWLSRRGEGRIVSGCVVRIGLAGSARAVRMFGSGLLRQVKVLQAWQCVDGLVCIGLVWQVWIGAVGSCLVSWGIAGLDGEGRM